MDTLTHALSGVLIGRATVKDTTQQKLTLKARLLAGFLAAAFPDIDFIARFFGVINYLEMHRGITHSFILLPLWALMLSHIFSFASRGKYHWKDFYLVAAMGITIHILGDVITAYGTMFLAPFSFDKFAWPTTFIIDLRFTGIILLALILSRVFKDYGRKITVAGLAVLLSYIGYQAILYNQAKAVGLAYLEKNNFHYDDLYVMPQPFSLYHWKIIIRSGEKYHVAYTDLAEKKEIKADENAGFFARLDAIYQPAALLKWELINKYGEKTSSEVKAVWELDEMAPIRTFMMFPVVSSLRDGGCYWFKDHRFILGNLRQSPFVFGACKQKGERWKIYRKNSEGIEPV